MESGLKAFKVLATYTFIQTLQFIATALNREATNDFLMALEK